MNKTKESSLWKWLRGAEKYCGALLHWERVENLVAKGTPDVMGCVEGSTFSLELKSVERPKRPTTPLHLNVTNEQALWAKARHKAGGRHWFLVCVGGDKRYLVQGLHALMLVEPLTEEMLESFSDNYGSTVFELIQWIKFTS